jgi:hypothetical protein
VVVGLFAFGAGGVAACSGPVGPSGEAVGEVAAEVDQQAGVGPLITCGGCAAPNTCCHCAVSPFFTCDLCVNEQTDGAHCGSCTNACGYLQHCDQGHCCGIIGTWCPAQGACEALQTDPLNCGACGHVCPGGESCVAGACKMPCSDDYVCVKNGLGICVGSPSYCQAEPCSGSCTFPEIGYGSHYCCGGQCTNTWYDPHNCTSCNYAAHCANGVVCCAALQNVAAFGTTCTQGADTWTGLCF